MRVFHSSALFCMLIVLTTGCNIVKSSINFTYGTQYLEQLEFEKAAFHLEKAVELDPSMVRNHTNLATAYRQLGEFDKAWKEYREACTCPTCDSLSIKNFREFYHIYVTCRDIDKIGTSRDEIEDQLGPPDMILAMGNQYTYGTCLMTFENNKLVNVVFFDGISY